MGGGNDFASSTGTRAANSRRAPEHAEVDDADDHEQQRQDDGELDELGALFAVTAGKRGTLIATIA
jgi:hypothetical protein